MSASDRHRLNRTGSRCPQSITSRLRRRKPACRDFRRTSTIGAAGFGVFYVSVRLSGLARREYWLFAVLLTCAAFAWYGSAFAARLSQPAHLVGIFAWLFVAILGSALSVVRHADRLAMRLGEPYGTLILTLAITFRGPGLLTQSLMSVLMSSTSARASVLFSWARDLRNL